MSSTGTFDTNDVRCGGERRANYSRSVPFPIPYIAPPGLLLGLNLIDIGYEAGIRITANANNITTDGFEVHVGTWADTILHREVVSWLELSPEQWEYQYGQVSTMDDHPWNKPQQKTCLRINFMRSFMKPPKVVVFLNQIDMARDKNWRVITTATDIDKTGFTIHLDTWGDSVLYSANAGWIAYPEGKESVFSGRCSIGEVRPWDVAQHQNSDRIDFGLRRKPAVFAAINSLDVGCSANLRVHSYIDSITDTGMTWHIDSWGDSVLYGGGLSYIVLTHPRTFSPYLWQYDHRSCSCTR